LHTALVGKKIKTVMAIVEKHLDDFECFIREVFEEYLDRK
jgi:hypothetical protein